VLERRVLADLPEGDDSWQLSAAEALARCPQLRVNSAAGAVLACWRRSAPRPARPKTSFAARSTITDRSLLFGVQAILSVVVSTKLYVLSARASCDARADFCTPQARPLHRSA